MIIILKILCLQPTNLNKSIDNSDSSSMNFSQKLTDNNGNMFISLSAIKRLFLIDFVPLKTPVQPDQQS